MSANDIFHTPLGTTNIPPSFLEDPMMARAIYDTSRLDDIVTMTYADATGNSHTVRYRASELGFTGGHTIRDNWELKKGEEKMNIEVDRKVGQRIYVARCRDMLDLSPERILTTLSALKGRLMLEISPIHVQEIRCNMTMAVKRNIITASKRLKMYGKKPPIIARFDEYGNQLPEEIHINDTDGIIIRFMDSPDPNALFLELEAIAFPPTMYNSKAWGSPYEQEDLPF